MTLGYGIGCLGGFVLLFQTLMLKLCNNYKNNIYKSIPNCSGQLRGFLLVLLFLRWGGGGFWKNPDLLFNPISVDLDMLTQHGRDESFQ